MKKIVCCLMMVVIVLGGLTSCGEKGPVKNVFGETEYGKVFSLTYDELISVFNEKVQEDSQKISDVDYDDSNPDDSITNVLYYYPIPGETSRVNSSILLISADKKTNKVGSINHNMKLKPSDVEVRLQWEQRVEALIMSIDQDMDQSNCKELTKQLGVHDSKLWKEGYKKTVNMHGIQYSLSFDLKNYEEVDGSISFFCMPEKEEK